MKKFIIGAITGGKLDTNKLAKDILPVPQGLSARQCFSIAARVQPPFP
jgi:hypothetical protein